MGLGFVLERALSGWAIATFPLSKNTGLAHTFATGADKRRCRRVLAVVAAAAALGMAAAYGAIGAAMMLAVLATFAQYRFDICRRFGGLSGDLAGWFVQRAELWMLAALAAGQLIAGRLV